MTMSLFRLAPWRARQSGKKSQNMKAKQRRSVEGRYLVFDRSSGAVSVRLGDFLKSEKAQSQLKDLGELRRRALAPKSGTESETESAAFDHAL